MEGMEVVSVVPFGYCSGVERAMEIGVKAKEENPGKDVYLLGSLIHNENAIAFLKSKGLRLFDESSIDLEQALLGLSKGDIVVFSAHGHPSSYDDIIEKKGLIAYDATCRFVNENLAAATGKSPLVYIGQEGHLEKEAFLANCPRAYFYSVSNGGGNWRDCPPFPYLIAQTTLSGEEIQTALADITASLGQASLIKGRCLATSMRQKAMKEAAEKADVSIVLGSKTSNNSKKLFQIASTCHPAFLCLDLSEVEKIDLSGYSKIALASGTSTSRETFIAVRDYLDSL